MALLACLTSIPWLTVLPYAALIIWVAVMAFMASGSWAAATGRAVRRGDPMRLACFITAAVFAGYILRQLYWTGDTTSGVALRLAGMADAIYILTLGAAYGRGEHL